MIFIKITMRATLNTCETVSIMRALLLYPTIYTSVIQNQKYVVYIDVYYNKDINRYRLNRI